MYTPIIAPSDLTTHIYPEILYEITRSDAGTIASNQQALTAIQGAVDELKIYMTKYDKVAIFGDQVLAVAPTWTPDSLMLDIVKTVAIWKLMNLANASLYYESWKERYNASIKTMEKIQAGKADPPSWPQKQVEDQANSPNNTVFSQSRPKRNNNF
jgi:Protein of unknown function (DUF1320)